MLALATSSKNLTKIDEKSHVFWNVDFNWILKGFWEGFGRPKSSIFALFSMFFRYHFSSAVRKAKNRPKMRKKQTFPLFGVGFAVVPRLLGKGKDRGKNTSDIRANSIELPQGGATAASPFVCKNVGGLPCIEGLHLQDCIAEGTWGNESPHFGNNLPRLCYEFKTLVRNTFLPKEPRKRRTFSKNRSQNPSKSRPGASKIEPRAIQNVIFQDI